MIDEAVEEIREMQTHSSSAVAITATEALLELCDRDYATVEEFERAVEHNSNALRRANPSHASLFNAQRAVVEGITDSGATTVEDAKDRLRSIVTSVVEDVETAKRTAAANASELFDDGMTILTHDFSTTVIGAMEDAALRGAQLTVYATEARPRFLGRRTARTLAPIDHVETHLIVDGAAGYYLPRCDRVVVGMDCIVDDLLYNRIGTYPIVATAAHAGVPVTVVGSGAKVIEEGFVFENDFRTAVEVMREPSEGFRVDNPAYDATPVSLLDSLVTDGGMRTFD